MLVEDTVVDERLILKFLNPNVSQDEEMMKRFVHELRYSRKITHKNVIRIYDFLYIARQLRHLDGVLPVAHARQRDRQREAAAAAARVQYGIDIATGMTVAHQVGIVHRDLKPANILINNEGLLKIVDFGVAAAAEGRRHAADQDRLRDRLAEVHGARADPRQEGRPARRHLQLGVIMYEMLTGQPPYSRGDHMSVMYQHVQGKAKAPIEVNPSVPRRSPTWSPRRCRWTR